MMPGLVHSMLSCSTTTASTSTSRATDRAAAPKPFNYERSCTNHMNAVGDIHSSSSSIYHHAFRMPQTAMRLQSCPINPPPPTTAAITAAEIPMLYRKPNTRPIELRRFSEYGTASVNSRGIGCKIEAHVEPNTICLAAMVDEFIQDEDNSSCACSGHTGSGCIQHQNSNCEVIFSAEDTDANAVRRMQSLACFQDEQEIRLLKDVESIVKGIDQQGRWLGHRIQLDEMRVEVANALRRRGYEAGVCKARWDHAASIPAGCYEYIDILFPMSSSQADELPPAQRLLVDIDFRSQFEIARPTSQFCALVVHLPPIFVGREERLQQMVLAMADATQRSLCAQGLHLPPWRKAGYMTSKWMSPYSRSVSSSLGRGGHDNENQEEGGEARPPSTEWQLPMLDEASLSRRPVRKMAGLRHSLLHRAVSAGVGTGALARAA